MHWLRTIHAFCIIKTDRQMDHSEGKGVLVNNNSLYENYYVCYASVYDLNELTLSNQNKTDYINELDRVTNVIKRFEKVFYHQALETCKISVHLNLFSNYFILSFKSSESTNEYNRTVFDKIQKDLCDIQYWFSLHDVWINGGIAYGPFYNSGDINIGPALVNAVLASKDKRKPFIYLHDSIQQTDYDYIDWMFECFSNDKDQIAPVRISIRKTSCKHFSGYSNKYSEIKTYFKETVLKLGVKK